MKKRGAFFYILIILALLAVAALAFLLAPGRRPATPAVVLPTPPAADSSAPAAPEDRIGGQIIAVTPETVQTALATLRRIDSYSRTLRVCDCWTGGARSRTVEVRARGGQFRLEIRSDGDDAVEHVLLRDGEKWIWYSDSDAVWHGPASDGDADAYQTLLTYEDVLARPVSDIVEAGYQEYAGRSCLTVRYRSGLLGGVSVCWIDPETGLLMAERCYEGDRLIYSMDSDLPDVSTPDEAYFAAP